MKSNKIYTLILILVVLFSNCGKSYTIDIDLFKQSFVSSFHTLDSTQQKFYSQIYDTVNPRPIWYQTSHDFNHKLGIFRNYLNSSFANHGINPNVFKRDSIENLILSIDTLNIDYQKLSKLDMMISKSYFDYCSALKFGYCDPIKLYPEEHFIEVKRPDNDFLKKSFEITDNAVNLDEYLSSIQPKTKNYLKMQQELSFLSRLKDSTFKSIPLLKDKTAIKVGQKHPSMALLAHRMMIAGTLPYNARYDTVKTLSKNLLSALNNYRSRYNLEKTAALDNSTINMLNKSFNSLFWTLAANMERMRWTPTKPISDKHVWVNVANAQLYMMRGDSITETLKVGVGKSNEHQTPLLIGEMYEVFLNPTWTVPSSIVINEISKKGRGASIYLARNNMRVYKNGIQQNPYSIDWSKISEKNQPYSIVQDSGSNNSLGRVKFNFYNPHSIYLHDTNAKYIFNSHQRDVSHGCVRVKDPLKLAYFCLNDIDTTDAKQVKKRKLYEDKIRYAIRMKPLLQENLKIITESNEKKLRRIKLDPKVTVIIDYRTCFVNNKGTIIFTKDYYNLDDVLIKKLNNIPIIIIPEKSLIEESPNKKRIDNKSKTSVGNKTNVDSVKVLGTLTEKTDSV